MCYFRHIVVRLIGGYHWATFHCPYKVPLDNECKRPHHCLRQRNIIFDNSAVMKWQINLFDTAVKIYTVQNIVFKITFQSLKYKALFKHISCHWMLKPFGIKTQNAQKAIIYLLIQNPLPQIFFSLLTCPQDVHRAVQCITAVKTFHMCCPLYDCVGCPHWNQCTQIDFHSIMIMNLVSYKIKWYLFSVNQKSVHCRNKLTWY